MSDKGFQYAYRLESGHIDEVSEVCWAYTMTSHWKEVRLVSDGGFPTHMNGKETAPRTIPELIGPHFDACNK